MRSVILILAALLVTTTAFFIKPIENEIESMTSERQKGEPRISGGEEAPLHKFSYHVALYSESENKWFSGALITDRWIITTAYVAIFLPLREASALLGAHEPNITEVTQQKIEIDMKIIHESYEDNDYVNNIALLRLKTAAQLDRFVSPVMLAPFNSPDFDGARLVFTGFGSTALSNYTQSQTLRYIVLNGISNSVCKRMRTLVNDGNVCVETTGGKGGCYWDWGGPLVDVESGLLVGLSADWFACYPLPQPDVFTRVSNFTRWIMDSIENNTRNV